MENIVILVLAAGVILFAAIATVRRFTGRGGGCCGGGGYKIRRKKLDHVVMQKTFLVSGMHCEHCKNRVEEVVNDIHGVSGRVSLRTGELTVSYAQPVDDAVIRRKVERAGYTVTGVR